MEKSSSAIVSGILSVILARPRRINSSGLPAFGGGSRVDQQEGEYLYKFQGIYF